MNPENEKGLKKGKRGNEMTKIMLICSAGMSTSFLVKKMQEEADKKGLESKIWAVGEADARSAWEEADILLLGPQIKYQEEKIKAMVEGKVPVAVIDRLAYGTMNGKKALEDALALLK